jgi:hypothetical protein
MKLAMLALVATVAFPLAAFADSSQPNSAPGLEGQPVTSQGEGTTGMDNSRAYRDSGNMGMYRSTGMTETRKMRRSGSDNSMDFNEPMGRR